MNLEQSLLYTVLLQCIFSLDMFYLIFRSVSANNMNWIILHYVRPSF